MQKVMKYVDLIDEELEGAKQYAECYVWNKANQNNTLATRYKEMAMDELKHGEYLHSEVVDVINKLKNNYPQIPQKMQDVWDKSHNKYVERSAWVKQMLTM